MTFSAASLSTGAGDRSGGAPRLLIVRVGAMGDVLHALPAVAALRTWLPQAWIGWAIEPRWASLLRASPGATPGSAAMPLVDHVHEVPARQWSKRPFSSTTLQSILGLRRDLRERRYDLAVDLQGSFRSAVIAQMSGAPTVVGANRPREWPARLLYTDPVATTAVHVIDQGVQLARAALGNMKVTDGPADLLQSLPPLPRDSTADAWVTALLVQDQAAGEHRNPPAMQTLPEQDLDTFSDQPIVLLATTAGWGAKQWPAERFGALAASLVQQGCQVLLNSTPSFPDATTGAVFDSAIALLPPGRHKRLRIVAASVPQLVALLRHCSLVVAGDTGPLHLAAALGVPVVALFGPTDPARNGPHTANSIVLRDPSSTTDHRRHPATEAGLACIGVDTVLAAALALLQARK